MPMFHISAADQHNWQQTSSDFGKRVRARYWLACDTEETKAIIPTCYDKEAALQLVDNEFII